MKKVCIIGHFGFGENLLNGQTIKTKIVTMELEKQLGNFQVIKIDTHGGIKMLPLIMINVIKAFKISENIIILPAHNGIKIFVPLCNFMNIFYKRKLHYVVIGGWLNKFLNTHKYLEKKLKRFNGIYVETNGMKKNLIDKGFVNIYVMPNFKNIKILNINELFYNNEEPFHLCTFSRVMKEKGIEEAIEAVKKINLKYNREVFTLDIYGQIENNQVDWFNDIKSNFPEYVNYKGLIAYDKSTEVLKKYRGLLFLTYYEGEGFAGTLLDAMAAGVPVIATDWKYNKEIINENNGIIVPLNNLSEVLKSLEICMSENWQGLKINCITEAEKYLPKTAINILIDNL